MTRSRMVIVPLIASLGALALPRPALAECLDRSPGPMVPVPDSSIAVTFDALRNVLVCMGGSGTICELVNGAWITVQPVVPRTWPSVVRPGATYRSATGESIVFALSTDIHAWNGQSWSTLPPLPGPLRIDTALAYDPMADLVYAFGGTVPGESQVMQDLWAFDGAGWSQVMTRTAPPPRRRAALAWDSHRQRLVLFGGNSSADILGDTWEFDGVDWIDRSGAPGPAPTPRSEAVLVFEPDLGVMLLRGGFGGSVPQPYDTWSWDGTRWVERYPTGANSLSSVSRGALDPVAGILYSLIPGALSVDRLIITATAPTIVQQPSNTSVPPGFPAQFTVDAEPSASFDGLAWQWRRNGTPIPGATMPVLTLPAVEPADMGAYDCVIRNGGVGELNCGRVITTAAMLTVVPGATCAGDITGDGIADFQDLLVVLSAWGPCP